MKSHHTFHIPVMGTGYSIDTPIKVACYGISSVISLVDDTLIEQVRQFYAKKFNEDYSPITKDDPDCRSKRITEYLNLVDKIVKQQFEKLKESAFELGSEITKYFELLPEESQLKKIYLTMCSTKDKNERQKLQDYLRSQIAPGEIEVNIMTKLDRQNFTKNGTPLSDEFSDALSALRGFALSRLESAVVLSAGLNQRLFNYLKKFKDFYIDTTGHFKKRIILKVSDYRSALLQGKMLVKKGLWVSEFRIESGLNCGGHVFPTDGYLMGPILKEFQDQREELFNTLKKTYRDILKLKDKVADLLPANFKITAQGGIGTAEEDQFLRKHYELDGTGWGTPFLLCPDVINVDGETLKQLCAAEEADLYISRISPMGILFSNLRGNSTDQARNGRIEKGKPGMPHCTKGHLALNVNLSDHPLCPASEEFQRIKIEELKKQNLSEEEFKKAYDSIVEKSCICHNLGNAALRKLGVISSQAQTISVCPGPNLAYFSRLVSLKEMIDHIYGRQTVLNGKYRPHMFLKEIEMYVEYFESDIKNLNLETLNERKRAKLVAFKDNMIKGMDYYSKLFNDQVPVNFELKQQFMNGLQALRQRFEKFVAEVKL